MIGIEMLTLTEKHSKLRCSDKYNHRPESDGTILIGILVGKEIRSLMLYAQ